MSKLLHDLLHLVTHGNRILGCILRSSGPYSYVKHVVCCKTLAIILSFVCKNALRQMVIYTFEQELMLICFMDIRVLIPFGKVTRFFPLFLVVRLPLGIFAEVIVYCCSTV
jgi:hypothetical protein